MRKTSAALAALSLVAVALTGCASAPSFQGEACDRASSRSGVDGSVRVSGEIGVAPDVDVYAPITVEKTSFTDVITGEGTPLTSPDQVMVVDFAFFDGSTGTQIVQSEFDGDLSRLTNIATFSQSYPGSESVLQCATPGTRMVAALSPDDTGVGFPVIAVIDVLDTQLARATGSHRFNDAHGLPTVVRAPDGRPGIIVPDTEAPTDEVVQVLIDGDGPVVEAGEAPWVNYTAVDWETREQRSSTWGTTPTPQLAQTAPEVAEALEGLTVGSQVMVVLPAEGETAASVYVVDILGAGSAPAQ